MWTRGDIEAEIANHGATRLLDDCWEFKVCVSHLDGSESLYTVWAYTTVRPDGLYRYCGISPQYARDGMLITSDELIAMARENRQPKLSDKLDPFPIPGR
jgi:hypothetical protein